MKPDSVLGKGQQGDLGSAVSSLSGAEPRPLDEFSYILTYSATLLRLTIPQIRTRV